MEEEVQAMKIIDKIKDQKLKELVKAYLESKNPNYFLEILEYFHIKIDKESIDDVITDYSGDESGVILGGIILNGELYAFALMDIGIGFALIPSKIDMAFIEAGG